MLVLLEVGALLPDHLPVREVKQPHLHITTTKSGQQRNTGYSCHKHYLIEHIYHTGNIHEKYMFVSYCGIILICGGRMSMNNRNLTGSQAQLGWVISHSY